MALFDDKWWLLSHIQHSFVLSDETGMAELALTDKDSAFALKTAREVAAKEGTTEFLRPLEEVGGDQEFKPRSFDIRPGRNQLGYHRPRCNTEIQLEKLIRRENRAQPDVKVVNWRECQGQGSPTNQELDEFFARKDLEDEPTPKEELEDSKMKKSLLAYQLETRPEKSSNPFDIYAKFNGEGVPDDIDARRIQIYLEMAEGGDRSFPMTVKVLASAKVEEVIGFICCRYSEEERHPPLKPGVENYALYIAETDGTIEVEFPALDKHEPFHKYGFATLGLVQTTKDSAADETDSSPLDRQITMFLPDGTFTVVEVATKETPLSQLMEKALARRRSTRKRPGVKFTYFIEKKDEPGKPLDQESLLSAYNTKEFYIVREHSRRREDPYSSATAGGGSGSLGDLKSQRPESHQPLRGQLSLIESAGLYQEFHDVCLLTSRMRARVDVVLALSQDRVEIFSRTNVANAGAAGGGSGGSSHGGGVLSAATKQLLWLRGRQKSISYRTESVVECDVLERRSSRWVVRIVVALTGNSNQSNNANNVEFADDHSHLEYKRHDLECSEENACEIVSRLNHVISWSPSQARAAYLAHKERKALQRRQSWHYHGKKD